MQRDGSKLIAVNVLQSMSEQLESDQKADEDMKDKFAGRLATFVSLQMLVEACRSLQKLAAVKDCWCKQNNKDKTTAIAAVQEKLSSLTALVEVWWEKKMLEMRQELGPCIDQLGRQVRAATGGAQRE